MAIGNLGNKISESDSNRVKDIRNPPEFEPGFEDKSSDGFDELFGDQGFSFDDLNDSGFGSSNNSGNGGFGNDDGFGSNGGFGNDGFGNNGFGNNGFGNNGFGNSGFGNSGFGNNGGFGGMGVNQPQQPDKPDILDKAIEFSSDTALTLGKVLVEVFKSIGTRTADDFGYLSSRLIIIGGICIGSGVIAGIIGAVLQAKVFQWGNLPIQIIGAGMLSCGVGLAGLGFSAIKITQTQASDNTSIAEIPDISEDVEDDATEEYEENLDGILDDLFSEDPEDQSFSSVEEVTDDSSNGTDEDIQQPVFSAPVKVDFNSALDSIHENQYINRETLFNTFKTFLPLNTVSFADRVEITSDEEEFNQLETISLKALSNVAKCELEDLNSRLESAYSTFFSYELRLKRIRGIKNTDEIAREMEAYFRENSSDTSVNATVDIEGDFYKVIITKGESAVVTFGDVFRQQYACDFFLDTGNKLPIITGIDELGKVILNDAKVYDTMLIAGKPRSGKSWYVLSVLMCLAMFNTPEDVEFIIVDPKESNLFNTFALLPHVAGLHNDKRILEIMDDLIENEAPRRKKLLADNRCDDIWAIRKKGVKLPVLYLVIDEYITVRNNLGALDKELDVKLQTIISQLPSLGIRLLIVPHRATGVVNKTNRTMLQFTASVKGDIEDVKDTLGITKWTRALTKPGDIAIKTSTMQNATYVRGAALTTSDDDNAEMIKNIAKAFYKMGVDLPDNSAMKIAAVRDEDYIRQELQEDGHRVQFSTLNFDKD